MCSDKELIDNDIKCFRKAMHDVSPLISQKRMPAYRETINTPNNIQRNYLNEAELPVYLPSHVVTDIQSEDTLSFCQSGIPKRQFSRLKNGHIRWEAKLDLHGLTIETAKTTLVQFIQLQIKIPNRCFLLIHGKGGYNGKAPILKNLINEWLQSLPEILAFHSAMAKDGGKGAVYVLLKRSR